MLGAGGIFGKKLPQAVSLFMPLLLLAFIILEYLERKKKSSGLTPSAAVMFSAYFGRYPVMFYFLVVATATAAWCAAATGYNSFMAARVLNGFFSTVTQGGGMMFIQDMFFFHERARKVNIWA